MFVILSFQDFDAMVYSQRILQKQYCIISSLLTSLC